MPKNTPNDGKHQRVREPKVASHPATPMRFLLRISWPREPGQCPSTRIHQERTGPCDSEDAQVAADVAIRNLVLVGTATVGPGVSVSSHPPATSSRGFQRPQHCIIAPFSHKITDTAGSICTCCVGACNGIIAALPPH